jgi:hypothetical protein
MKLEEWVERHRLEGHYPHPAPTGSNPERWDCDSGGLWRILTREQIMRKFAHLRKRPTPALESQQRELQAHIAEIQAEQGQRNAALHKIDHSHISPLRIAARYAGGRPRARRRGQLRGLL